MNDDFNEYKIVYEKMQKLGIVKKDPYYEYDEKIFRIMKYLKEFYYSSMQSENSFNIEDEILRKRSF